VDVNMKFLVIRDILFSLITHARCRYSEIDGIIAGSHKILVYVNRTSGVWLQLQLQLCSTQRGAARSLYS